MEVGLLVTAAIIMIVGMALAPTIFTTATNQVSGTGANYTASGGNPNEHINGTAGTFVGLIPIIYMIGVIVVALGVAGLGIKG